MSDPRIGQGKSIRVQQHWRGQGALGQSNGDREERKSPGIADVKMGVSKQESQGCVGARRARMQARVRREQGTAG